MRLTAYVNCHIPEEQISRLVDDPDIQKELGITRNRGEEMPTFQARMKLMQLLLGRSKLDANFLLGQLHFDLGDYGSAEFMLKNRTLGDNRAHLGSRPLGTRWLARMKKRVKSTKRLRSTRKAPAKWSRATAYE
ncbi:MAG: hypothetical protein U0892_15845 [Pirellulales bacterium]